MAVLPPGPRLGTRCSPRLARPLRSGAPLPRRTGCKGTLTAHTSRKMLAGEPGARESGKSNVKNTPQRRIPGEGTYRTPLGVGVEHVLLPGSFSGFQACVKRQHASETCAPPLPSPLSLPLAKEMLTRRVLSSKELQLLNSAPMQLRLCSCVSPSWPAPEPSEAGDALLAPLRLGLLRCPALRSGQCSRPSFSAPVTVSDTAGAA